MGVEFALLASFLLASVSACGQSQRDLGCPTLWLALTEMLHELFCDVFLTHTNTSVN